MTLITVSHCYQFLTSNDIFPDDIDIIDIINIRHNNYVLKYGYNNGIHNIAINIHSKHKDLIYIMNTILQEDDCIFTIQLKLNNPRSFIYDLNFLVNTKLLLEKYNLKTISPNDLLLIKLFLNNTEYYRFLDFDIEFTKKPCNPTTNVLAIQPKSLHLKLYNYQLKTIKWMNDLENHNKSLNNPHFTIFNRITLDLLRYKNNENNSILKCISYDVISNEIIYNDYQPYIFSTKGGIIADEMGLGKTITVISHIQNDKKYSVEEKFGKNLIICQNHLIEQWDSEIKTHTKLKVITIVNKTDHEKLTYENITKYDVVLISLQFLLNVLHYYGKYIKPYDKNEVELEESLKSPIKKRGQNQSNDEEIPEEDTSDEESKEIILLHLIKWKRLIVDEGHELFNNYSYRRNQIDKNSILIRWLQKIIADFKWIISGTAFTSDTGFKHMIKFLDFKIHYTLNFKDKEYDIEVKYEDLKVVNFNLFSKDILSKIYCRNTKQSIENEHKFKKIKNKIIYINFTPIEKELYSQQKCRNNNRTYLRQLCCHFNISEAQMNMLGNNPVSLEDVRKKMIDFYNNKIKKAQKILDEMTVDDHNYEYRKQEWLSKINNWKYVIRQFENINPINPALKDEECIICLCEFTDPVMTSCGHIYCKECLQNSFKVNKNCPLCREIIKSFYLINKKEEELDYETYKYGSKMAMLMKIVRDIINKDPNNKIIIFSQWDRLLHTIGKTLILNDINTVYLKGTVYQKINAISSFKKGKNKKNNEVKVIMLSTTQAGSGTNLIETSHIIFMDPIDGTKHQRENIENQAIGRANRIGQNKEIKVIKLITKDTIEEEIFNSNQ